MERSRSYLLTIICLIAILFGLYVWSDKQETSRNLQLAVSELRELKNRLDENAANDVPQMDTMFAEIGSGDMK